MTEPQTNPGGVAPGEQVKLRILLSGGAFVAGLGVFAFATDKFGRGFVYLGIGLLAIFLGVKMAHSVTEGAEAAAFSLWYTAALGLALMSAGAAVTTYARDATSTEGQVGLFLAAGVLLWMGVTCVIAAVVKTRRAAAK